MESILVSARVPQAKKNEALAVLKSLGATTSDLINDAFDYVIEEKRLPRDGGRPKRPVDDFAAFVEATTIAVDWGTQAEDGDYRCLVRNGKAADYDSLA